MERCSFWVSCEFNAKSGAIEQLRLGERPVHRHRLFDHPCGKSTSTFAFLDIQNLNEAVMKP